MKKEKINVKICLGTACFVQGGADLLLYSDFVEPSILEHFEVEGCTCLNQCKVGNGSAPFVEINGKVYDSINQEKFCKLLAEEVGKNA